MTALEQLLWAGGIAVFLVVIFWFLTNLTTKLSSSGTLAMRTDIIGLDQEFSTLKKSHEQDLVLIRRAIEHEEDLRREVTRRVERLETGLADVRLRVDEHIAES